VKAMSASDKQPSMVARNPDCLQITRHLHWIAYVNNAISWKTTLEFLHKHFPQAIIPGPFNQSCGPPLDWAWRRCSPRLWLKRVEVIQVAPLLFTNPCQSYVFMTSKMYLFWNWKWSIIKVCLCT
jgi:hypothetical protein